MPMVVWDDAAEIGAARGDAVIVVPLFGSHESFTRCLSSILRHTDRAVPVLIADDASVDPASRSWVEALDVEHSIYWLQQPVNLGFVLNCNSAFAATTPADVLLVNSDVEVAEGWFDGLRDAAYSDTGIATATALSNHASILSVPGRDKPQPAFGQSVDFEISAAWLREHSPRMRPRIPTAVGHAVWIKRSALELVGVFDECFAPAYGEEVDFSLRCTAAGMQHVAADDVLVAHDGEASHGRNGKRSPVQKKHEALVNERYPYYAETVRLVATQRFSPLATSLAVANQSVRKLSVTIDGRCLTQSKTGTQFHVLNVIAALARTDALSLRVLVPSGTGAYAKSELESFGDLEILETRDVFEGVTRSDIVHRPFQVQTGSDMGVLANLGDRIIITNQDLIGFRNASYYESARDWQTYRRLTAESLALSSLVLFFSEHARDDAISEGLVTHEKSRVVLIAPDGEGADALEDAARPASRVDLEERPFLLCLGTTFRHKNRIFAMRLLRALKERHGWDGRLVLAGPNVSNGSSLGDEAEWLSLNPAVAGDVVALPAMSEAEKNWLYENCTAVVYPTTYEGFGLVPFEASNFDKPTFFAPVTSLAELFPAEAALLVPWNEDESADRVINVLRDPGVAAELVAQIRAAGAKRSWDDTAQELLDAYDAVISAPSTDILRLDGPKLTVDERYWGFRLEMDPAGLSLVDPAGALLPKEAQRTIAGLARRPATRAALLASLRGLRRLASTDELDDEETTAVRPRIFDDDLPRS